MNFRNEVPAAATVFFLLIITVGCRFTSEPALLSRPVRKTLHATDCPDRIHSIQSADEPELISDRCILRETPFRKDSALPLLPEMYFNGTAERQQYYADSNLITTRLQRSCSSHSLLQNLCCDTRLASDSSAIYWLTQALYAFASIASSHSVEHEARPSQP